MKIALVHDYLKEYGGAERVLSALCEIFPEAPIYTIFCLDNSSASKAFKDSQIIQSWFGKLPFADKLISPLRFLLPLIWGSFNFSHYDLVISSASWAVTKGFTQGKPKEICYCHTPPRYLYGYETSRNWKKHWYIRFYAVIVNYFMRLYDFNQAQKVTWFIANSREVQQRIKKFYRRESIVINPPVEIPKFEIPAYAKASAGKQNSRLRQGFGGQAKLKVKDYYLTGGRLEGAKNFELIIEACNKIKAPLKIYGTGSREKYLRSIAGPTVEFLGRVSDEEKFELMSKGKAFIVAATDEDFGITPVEAMATGRPVIAFRGGGYLETVVEGKTGIFFNEQTAESLTKALREFEDFEGKIKPEDCRKQAEKFSKGRFKREIMEFLDSHGFTTDSH